MLPTFYDDKVRTQCKVPLSVVFPFWFQIRIWARRTTINQGQGDYALNVTGPVLQFFQSYYNVSYPLTKSGEHSTLLSYWSIKLVTIKWTIHTSLTDQIALPDFYFGAMENWGLVTYRETHLLYDPLTSSNANKETTATIIAHELAHMVTSLVPLFILCIVMNVSDEATSLYVCVCHSVVWKPGNSVLVERGVAEWGVCHLRVLLGSRPCWAWMECRKHII